MSFNITIQKLSEQLGLTSRTLRHWEAEGLFVSLRDVESGWRCYDSRSVDRINLIALLRRYGISLGDIRKVLDNNSCQTLCSIIQKNIDALADQRRITESQEECLHSLLSALTDMKQHKLLEADLIGLFGSVPEKFNTIYRKEEATIMEPNINGFPVRLITLPPMRAAYYIAISTSPEDEALAAVTNWLKDEELLGTARLFGGNMPPLPKGDGKPYGYGVLASIPEFVRVPAPLKEMHMPGGLYAAAESSDDIAGSWNKLIDVLRTHDEYTSDRDRLCFEEHIRSDAPAGSGNEYFLRLMEPVKRK